MEQRELEMVSIMFMIPDSDTLQHDSYIIINGYTKFNHATPTFNNFLYIATGAVPAAEAGERHAAEVRGLELPGHR